MNIIQDTYQEDLGRMERIINTDKKVNKMHKVVVRFDQQQLQLLDNVKKTDRFGNTYEDVIINVFREYIKQNFDKSTNYSFN